MEKRPIEKKYASFLSQNKKRQKINLCWIPAISTKSEFSNPSKISPQKKYFFVLVGFQWTFQNGKNWKIAGFFRGFWGSGFLKITIQNEKMTF